CLRSWICSSRARVLVSGPALTAGAGVATAPAPAGAAAGTVAALAGAAAAGAAGGVVGGSAPLASWQVRHRATVRVATVRRKKRALVMVESPEASKMGNFRCFKADHRATRAPARRTSYRYRDNPTARSAHARDDRSARWSGWPRCHRHGRPL